MKRIAQIVEYETHEGKEQQFDTVIRAHAKACLEEEEGCLRFEILRPLDEMGRIVSNKFMANELFADLAALDSHRATSRWICITELFRLLLASRRSTMYEVEFQDQER